jgi:ABC-2 type transport system ATP-binding protein
MTLRSLIEVAGLRKSYPVGNLFGRKSVEVLHGVSLEVREGSVFGLLGPNGAGKTTTIKTLAGLIFPTSGSVLINGAPPWTSEGRRGLGFLPENPTFYDALTGREVLNLLGRLLNRRGDLSQEVNGLLERVGLAQAGGLQVRKYSKGMTQRLGIAQAILGAPPLVILDEPMSGLDPLGRHDVKDLIRTLRAAGTTILFSTHITADVEETCDSLAIMVGGQVVRSGTVQDIVSLGTSEFEIMATDVPMDFPGRPETPFAAAARFVAATEQSARETLEALWKARAHVISLSKRRARLEEVLVSEVSMKRALGSEDHAS